jgi:septal ring factor EnvC (AmiA/AmiB activator)
MSEYRVEGPGKAPSQQGRRLVPAAVALAVFLLAAAAGVAGYLAWESKSRADRWEARAGELERNVSSLNEVLVERSEALNERTEELNAMAATVRRAERAVSRSEADVRALERRQRELADEKAQVEDARAQLALQREELADRALALRGVADALVTCNSGLVQLVNYVLAEDFAAADAIYEGTNADCQAAEDELSAYNAAYAE